MPINRNLILLYHSFRDERSRNQYDGYFSPQGTVPVNVLESHLEWLSQFADFVSLNELFRSDRTSGWNVAVTLDDGYRNNLSLALPVFEQFGVPVTWFVSPKFVENDLLPWWDLVDFTARVAQPFVAIETKESEYRFDLTDNRDIACFRSRCRQWFLKAHPESASRIRTQIENSLPNGPPNNAFANREDIIEASQSPLVELGGHTESHPNLTRLSTAEARQEIRRGKEQLERWTNVSMRWFAYPYGGREHWDERIKQIVREEGFDGAVTTVRANANQGADRYEIPRLNVPSTRSLWKTKAWILAPNTCRELYRLKTTWIDGTLEGCKASA
jgi:peptidoglycan/xylan/chitin deacetylase (PgdA/CDA1 family)